MRLEDMTPEMVEEAKGRETTEERTAFIRENGVKLTDEQLEGIAGGYVEGEPIDGCKKQVGPQV